MVLPHPLHFLNPVALLGLLAALVPVAIHLLHRGRSRPVPFSNLALLRSLHQSRMRRLQLRQWLILLVRALAISLVALAFARPALHGSGGGPFGRPAPVRAAVLLDRSVSTGYRQPGGRVFDALRQQTQALVGLFGEGDDVAVIPFAADVRAGGLERRRLVEELAGLGTSAEGTDVAAALEAAERHLSAAPAGWRRELFLLGDRARAGWPAADSGPPRTWAAGAAVYVADPGPAPRANWFLASVVAETWLQAPGHRLDVVAQIASSAPRPANLGVDLFVDGQRLQRREVPLGPGQRVPVELSFAPRHAGPLAGYVEIDGDDLPLDDRRYFTLYVPATARVLVLGRDPRDTYFARTALAAAAGADAVLAVRSGLLSELSTGPLAGVDALILCNLSHLDREAARQVHDFVARGGTAVLFPGPDIDLSYYNRQLLPGLVPLVYKDQWGEPGSAPAARLDLDRIPHPLTAGLAAAPTPGFAALFEMVATQPITPLLATADGRLVAAEAPLGAGRVVLFAVPLSAAWSDLPLSG
ncbi:MAG: BatA domain-containing protein, partial [Gemmatimonadota bacterium]